MINDEKIMYFKVISYDICIGVTPRWKYSLFVCENRNPLTCTFIKPGMSCGQLYKFAVTFVYSDICPRSRTKGDRREI